MVSDKEPERLRYLASLGLKPGATFEVLSRQPFLGPGPGATHARPGTGGVLAGDPRRGHSLTRSKATMLSGEITIRVRYAETDRMGLLHHANYLVYFEQGRTELLRSRGFSYKDLEDQGYLLVLTRLQVRYRSPARYDDLLNGKKRPKENGFVLLIFPFGGEKGNRVNVAVHSRVDGVCTLEFARTTTLTNG